MREYMRSIILMLIVDIIFRRSIRTIVASLLKFTTFIKKICIGVRITLLIQTSRRFFTRLKWL